MHTVLLAIILLLIITIVWFHYANYRSKQKTFMHLQYKTKNEIQEVCIKNRTCYYYNGINKLEECDIDNILIDGKSPENVLIYDIWYKTLVGLKTLPIRFDKIDGF